MTSANSLVRIVAADDLLAATLARLPSAERMRHAPTVGVVKVLFGGVRTLPATDPDGADDEWVTLLDKLEPQFDMCEAAATVKDLTHRFTILDERIGHLLDHIAALAVSIEPHCTERERLVRLTLMAQQEILTVAGTQMDRKLARIEQTLARHRSTDEIRTGRFQESLDRFKAEFAEEIDRQTTGYDSRKKEWEDRFGELTGRLKEATHVEQVERIARFYDPAERQERVRANVYAALCVSFIVIAIVAAGFGFYAHQTTRSITTVAGSVTLFTLLSSAAGIMRRELRVHRDRQWAVEEDHRRLVRSVLFNPNMTDAQRERFVEELLNGNPTAKAAAPVARSGEPPKPPKPRPHVLRASDKER